MLGVQDYAILPSKTPGRPCPTLASRLMTRTNFIVGWAGTHSVPPQSRTGSQLYPLASCVHGSCIHVRPCSMCLYCFPCSAPQWEHAPPHTAHSIRGFPHFPLFCLSQVYTVPCAVKGWPCARWESLGVRRRAGPLPSPLKASGPRK